MPFDRAYYGVPGHALAAALRPLATPHLQPVDLQVPETDKAGNPVLTKDGHPVYRTVRTRALVQAMTRRQLHEQFGQGARRVKHHSTRPKFQTESKPLSTPKKGKGKGDGRK